MKPNIPTGPRLIKRQRQMWHRGAIRGLGWGEVKSLRDADGKTPHSSKILEGEEVLACDT